MNFQNFLDLQLHKSCAFTGHREVEADFNKELLENEIEKLINEGVFRFFNGGARGFDLMCAQIIIQLKRKYTNVELIMCIPCPNQEKYYTEEEKNLYNKVLKNADKIELLSDRYTKYCMLQRDRYMADQADVLFAYKRKENGGTAYTVNYFVKKYPYKRTVFI